MLRTVLELISYAVNPESGQISWSACPISSSEIAEAKKPNLHMTFKTKTAIICEISNVMKCGKWQESACLKEGKID